MVNKKELIEETKKVIAQYTSRLTLRQIYYRLVAKLIIPNTISSYKYLSTVLVGARLSGKIPWDSMEDRTRKIIGEDRQSYSSPESLIDTYVWAIKNCWQYWNLAKWQDQPCHVEVWLEKEALAGLFNQISDKRAVRLATCRGYPSATFLNDAATFLRELQEELKIKIFYFGDHDPSGIDIQRHVNQTLGQVYNLDFTIERIALTPEQIKTYSLPPVPAKSTDSRKNGFVKQYGDAVVELDALEPNILQEMIDSAIMKYFDISIYQRVLMQEERQQGELKKKLEKLKLIWE